MDARSDLYAVGAVAYFLLTGAPVFQGDSAVEICMHHVQTPPQSASQRLGRAVAQDLEDLLMRCLAKDPDARPQSAAELQQALGGCRDASAWTPADAEAWWREYSGTTSQAASASPTPFPFLSLGQLQ